MDLRLYRVHKEMVKDNEVNINRTNAALQLKV